MNSFKGRGVGKNVLKQAEDSNGVLSYALYRLNKWGETSQKLLRDALFRKTDNAEWVDEAIERVIDLGYQSDLRYAEMIVRGGLETKGWGRQRIAQELFKKGITKDVADEALLVLDGDNPVARAAAALAKRFKGEISDQKDKARAQRYLVSKGFGFDVVRSAVQQHNEGVGLI